ncbi:MAG: arginine deiminase, partial [Ilumatobacteraceae bacterium]|nr:arginine deiminase [Ilumatobacteraceae bacterium]
MNSFHVDSEVGALTQVLVHRPGHELRRPTASNGEGLLFEGPHCLRRARREHDALREVLAGHGVGVHLAGDLLAEAMQEDGARDWLLGRVVTEDELGADVSTRVRSFLEALDPVTLATHLVGGVSEADLHGDGGRSLSARLTGPQGSVLAPLPNQVFTRDSSCWIYDNLVLGSMAEGARSREALLVEAIYRFLPSFDQIGEARRFGGAERTHRSATIEGGDVLVLGNGAVVIGMGVRTTPAAVEALSRWLLATDNVTNVIATELPRTGSTNHLDAVLAMAAPATFVAQRDVVDGMRAWSLTAGRSSADPEIVEHDDLVGAIAAALDLAAIRVVPAEPAVPSGAERHDGGGIDVLALGHGTVVADGRNVGTVAALREEGLEVIALSLAELGQGRGGLRSMTCPLVRDAA